MAVFFFCPFWRGWTSSLYDWPKCRLQQAAMEMSFLAEQFSSHSSKCASTGGISILSCVVVESSSGHSFPLPSSRQHISLSIMKAAYAIPRAALAIVERHASALSSTHSVDGSLAREGEQRAFAAAVCGQRWLWALDHLAFEHRNEAKHQSSPPSYYNGT